MKYIFVGEKIRQFLSIVIFTAKKPRNLLRLVPKHVNPSAHGFCNLTYLRFSLYYLIQIGYSRFCGRAENTEKTDFKMILIPIRRLE